MDRKSWLDGLKLGSEVSIDYGDRGHKVRVVEGIVSRDGHERVFVAGGLNFDSSGKRFGYDGYENASGFCSLEDPDSELSTLETRREASRRCHIRETFMRIMTDPELVLSYEQMERMVRLVYPDYESIWK